MASIRGADGDGPSLLGVQLLFAQESWTHFGTTVTGRHDNPCDTPGNRSRTKQGVRSAPDGSGLGTL